MKHLNFDFLTKKYLCFVNIIVTARSLIKISYLMFLRHILQQINKKIRLV